MILGVSSDQLSIQLTDLLSAQIALASPLEDVFETLDNHTSKHIQENVPAVSLLAHTPVAYMLSKFQKMKST